VDGHTVVVGRLPVLRRPDEASDGPEARSAPLRLLGRAPQLALNLVFVAAMASVMIMLAPAALGFHRYVILTGSMTGTYDRGSIVFDRPVPVSGLKVGDPITYAPPPGFTSQKLVTHRIWWIGRGTNGQRVFRTKGDANKHPDAWKFTLNQATQDQVVFHIPELGYVFIVLSLRDFRVVLIGVPALIISLMLMRGLWREAGEEERRQQLAELGWREQPDAGVQAVLPFLDAPLANRRSVRIDLGPQMDRAAAPRAPRRPTSPHRTRLQVGAPLRVARRIAGQSQGGPHDARGHCSDLDQVGTRANTAEFRVHVGRLAPRSSGSTASGSGSSPQCRHAP